MTALVLAVVLSLVALVVRSITGPLASLENVMGELAQGKHAVAVAGTDRRDEVGAMARMVEVFRKRLIERQAQRELLRDNQIKLARLERQLEKASRASTAGEVSIALAHELNQPLASVVNYLDACRQYLTSSAPEAKDELPKLFDRATEQAGRAAGIVKGVRRFVRKDGLVQVPHDINQIVREIADVVLSSSDADRVALHLDLAEDLPPAMIDKVQIQQIVMNLIQNAVDAMYYADHPQLSITTSMDSNDQVLLTVSDNGRGLAAEVRANLFEPFVTTKPDGMGLGLTVGKSIAELHDGNLTVESDAGGTTFRLTLPRTPDAR